MFVTTLTLNISLLLATRCLRCSLLHLWLLFISCWQQTV